MKTSPSAARISRRRFIAATAAAVAAPTIIPASALGKDDQPAPSERIVVGIVGWGMMGPGNTKGLMAEKDCQVVAACDLDKRPLKQAVDAANSLSIKSDAMNQALVQGKPVDLHRVVLAQQEAQISFDLVMQMRDKLVSAYQEILRMPL